jgi:hypothetical protein
VRGRLAAIALLVASCGGLELEHRVRVGTDCPAPEVIARGLVYPIRGGVLICNHMHDRGRVYLDCQPPVYPEPPSERRRGI